MASLSPQPNGHTWVYVKAATGKRRPVRLGVMSPEDAQEAKRRLTLIEKAFQAQHPPDAVTLAWLASLTLEQRDRVIASGLVPADASAPIAEKSIERLIREWVDTLDVEPQTLKNLEQIFRNLRTYFGPHREVASLVPADADKFRAWLKSNGRQKSDKPMAAATVSKRCRTVKSIFDYGVRLKWITENPFEHLRLSGEVNPDRDVYVTPRLALRLVEVSEDPELAAMVALCRFSTFRGPSEFEPLAWSDIDFAESRVRITSPKTKRYPRGSSRVTPLDSHSLAALNVLWDAAPVGATLVFPRLGPLPSSDVTDRLNRVCRRLGIALWEKPWINMRASCETDWQQQGMSIFETASRVGHSPEVALRHYNRIAKDRVADLVD